MAKLTLGATEKNKMACGTCKSLPVWTVWMDCGAADAWRKSKGVKASQQTKMLQGDPEVREKKALAQISCCSWWRDSRCWQLTVTAQEHQNETTSFGTQKRKRRVSIMSENGKELSMWIAVSTISTIVESLSVWKYSIVLLFFSNNYIWVNGVQISPLGTELS